MRIEGDWARDGILIVRELFDQPRVARLRAVSEELLEQYRTLNPIDGKPGSQSATSLFQIHHPGFFGAGSPKLREILEAVADPNMLKLVRETCDTQDPMFSHTSMFFNPIEPRPPDSLGAGLPGSSACCGEWHRDAQVRCQHDTTQLISTKVGISHRQPIRCLLLTLVPHRLARSTSTQMRRKRRPLSYGQMLSSAAK